MSVNASPRFIYKWYAGNPTHPEVLQAAFSWCSTVDAAEYQGRILVQTSRNSFRLILNFGSKLFDTILFIETDCLPESSNNLLWLVNAIGNTFFFVFFFEETEYEKWI